MPDKPTHFGLGAVVFGRVIEGLGVVKKIESTGSRSGKTLQPVVLVDSGEV